MFTSGIKLSKSSYAKINELYSLKPDTLSRSTMLQLGRQQSTRLNFAMIATAILSAVLFASLLLFTADILRILLGVSLLLCSYNFYRLRESWNGWCFHIKSNPTLGVSRERCTGVKISSVESLTKIDEPTPLKLTASRAKDVKNKAQPTNKLNLRVIKN